ncbi:unnamed protein product [Gemmata massiliana]|uniref:NolW-like domain-containing protein n=1 Tax=Gemmata massiliana TaxID=1210884 RepID=A0A6P2DCJ5_9BACT|nr:hypothetical protein [Gemmata massiliana]VTR98075.1 unnamed protein product [Gemmata massiliana]
MRSTLCRMFAVAVFAVPVVTPSLARGAAPTPAAPAKTTSPMDAARKALDEVGDMNYQGKSLNEVIGDLKDRAKISVTIDPAVYQFGLDPNQPTVTVALKEVKLKDGLQQALAPFNLKCGLTRDGLYISTEEGLITKQFRQRVNVNCDGIAFGTAVKQLSADCGANIVIDPRLKDKANAAVTLKLDDVPLETAIRLMAEVADLGTVRMSNVLFVTTTERADKLRPNADGPTQPAPGNPVFPFPAGGPGGGPVPLPAVGGAAAPGVLLPANPVVAPDLPVAPPPEKPAKPPAPEKP